MSDTMPDPTYPADPTLPVPAPGSDPGVIPVEDDDAGKSEVHEPETIPTEDDEADDDANETNDEQPG